MTISDYTDSGPEVLGESLWKWVQEQRRQNPDFRLLVTLTLHQTEPTPDELRAVAESVAANPVGKLTTVDDTTTHFPIPTPFPAREIESVQESHIEHRRECTDL